MTKTTKEYSEANGWVKDPRTDRWNGPKFQSISTPTSAGLTEPVLIPSALTSVIVDGPISSQTAPGLKNDITKSRVDLLDPDFLLAVGDALRFGAEKYKEHGGSSNWRRGIHISRLVASALRHLFSIMRGEDIDSESGLLHTAHLGCCVQFLHFTIKYLPQFDDRYKYHEHGITYAPSDRVASQEPGKS